MFYLASFYRIVFNNWFHLITLKTASLNRMYNFTDNREVMIRRAGIFENMYFNKKFSEFSVYFSKTEANRNKKKFYVIL